jgi:uncharacterized membrane protein
MQSSLMSLPPGMIVISIVFWLVVAVVVVAVIRFAMRPTNDRLDRLARLLERQRDAGE